MTRLRKPVAGKPLTFKGRQWATSGTMVEWAERKPERQTAEEGGVAMTCVWEPSDEGTRTLVLQLDGSWFYSGDYGGCDDCGSKLLAVSGTVKDAPWTLRFQVDVRCPGLIAIYGARQFVTVYTDLAQYDLIWNGSAWTSSYPEEQAALPVGIYTFEFAIAANETVQTIWVGMGQRDTSNDPDPDLDCIMKDRAWYLKILGCLSE